MSKEAPDFVTPPPPKNDKICSAFSYNFRLALTVFKLVQDLLEPSDTKGKSRFQVLMNRLPSDHKARWFAGAALNTSE